MSNKKVSYDNAREIIKLYSQGKKEREIAEKMALRFDSVVDYIRKFNDGELDFSIAKEKLSDNLELNIIRLHLKDYNNNTIRFRLACSSNKVKSTIKRFHEGQIILDGDRLVGVKPKKVRAQNQPANVSILSSTIEKEIKNLKDYGLENNAIAKELGISRSDVMRYLWVN